MSTSASASASSRKSDCNFVFLDVSSMVKVFSGRSIDGRMMLRMFETPLYKGPGTEPGRRPLIAN